MTIAILINGAFGRMGQIATKTISENPKFELVGQTGREYDLLKSIQDSRAEVVIDFTHPESVFQNTLTILEAGARPIIGTSGLVVEQIKKLQKKANELKLGGIIAPNFSLGAVLMMKAAKDIIKYMPNVEIIERHHAGKADSPSGTALRSAELIANSAEKINPNAKSTIETVKGARGANYRDIPIHSIRLSGYLAQEEIIFGNPGETLTLTHNSIDRMCFMPGLSFACEKVMTLDHLVYGLEEIL